VDDLLKDIKDDSGIDVATAKVFGFAAKEDGDDLAYAYLRSEAPLTIRASLSCPNPGAAIESCTDTKGDADPANDDRVVYFRNDKGELHEMAMGHPAFVDFFVAHKAGILAAIEAPFKVAPFAIVGAAQKLVGAQQACALKCADPSAMAVMGAMFDADRVALTAYGSLCTCDRPILFLTLSGALTDAEISFAQLKSMLYADRPEERACPGSCKARGPESTCQDNAECCDGLACGGHVEGAPRYCCMTAGRGATCTDGQGCCSGICEGVSEGKSGHCCSGVNMPCSEKEICCDGLVCDFNESQSNMCEEQRSGTCVRQVPLALNAAP
jgi:hypothetical protein